MTKSEGPLLAAILCTAVVVAWMGGTLMPIFAGIVGIYMFAKIVRG